MVRFGRVAIVALLCALPACRKKAAEEAVRADETSRSAKPTAEAEGIFDAQGRLKSSGERVEWLELPMGFKKLAQSYGRHVLFQGPNVPLDKARDFFGARMFTGKVEEGPQQVAYRAVMPMEADARAVRLDVSLSMVRAVPDPQAGIAAGDEVLQLDIERLTYDGAQPLSDEQARKALASEQRRAE